MNLSVSVSLRRAIGFFAASLIFAPSAHAGPPLICHSIAIGEARSLPWPSHDANLSGAETYDVKNLVGDTLAILNSSTPVLVRMETLRRAALYARDDSKLAEELLGKLRARVNAAETAAQPQALALFDAGYFTEAYKQLHWNDANNPANGVDGYAWVKKALESRPDPQMEFAAALITMHGSKEEHREHVRRATAGAENDALLAENLASRFSGSRSPTIAELFAKSTTQNR
ncbi:MAG TPA: hypothetical protein VKB87_17060 [Myxococcaceae bacterium]|nr:hypothetical protein [Myxococcaceae bacterium]